LRLPVLNQNGQKTESLSFTVSIYADGGRQRQGGRRQDTATGVCNDEDHWSCSGSLYSAVNNTVGKGSGTKQRQTQ
jgi:hypothetical protein